MVKVEVIKERLSQLSNSIRKIQRYEHLSYEEFLRDEIAQDIVKYNIFIGINMIVDMANHIVVDNNIGKPNTLSEPFEILWREKYISEKDKIIYTNMVGFRNILSHEYVKISKEVVYNIMKNNIVDMKKFILFVHENFI